MNAGDRRRLGWLAVWLAGAIGLPLLMLWCLGVL